MDGEACPKFSFYFFKPCGRNNFPFKHWSSIPRRMTFSCSGRSGITRQSTIQLFLVDMETLFKVKLGSILVKLNQRHSRREQAKRFDRRQNDYAKDNCTSSQILQIRMIQIFYLQESLERYCNVLRVFGFSSAKGDLNYFNSHLLLIFATDVCLVLFWKDTNFQRLKVLYRIKGSTAQKTAKYKTSPIWCLVQ